MHPALGNYVVLQGIFSHFSDSELREVLRLVCRGWNFSAVSQLISRKYQPSLVKLNRYSSEPGNNRDFEGYWKLERERRQLWTHLYGAECPMIEFRNVECSYPSSKSAAFCRLVRSDCFASVSRLTLSNFDGDRCLELLIRVLDGCSSLRTLNCYSKPTSAVFGGLESGLWDLNMDGVDLEAEDTLEEPRNCETKLIHKYAKLNTLLVCFGESTYSFPWILLQAFSNLETLEICFYKVADLEEIVKHLITAIPPREIANLEITLLRDEQFLDYHFEKNSELFDADNFPQANALLCNHFVVKKSLTLSTLLSAVFMFGFMKSLKKSPAARLNIEWAVPWMDFRGMLILRTHEAIRDCLLPEIADSFPRLEDLKLRFFKYLTETFIYPLPFGRDEALPNTLCNLKSLHVTEWPHDDPRSTNALVFRKWSWYGWSVIQSSGFKHISRLIVQVGEYCHIRDYFQAIRYNSTRVKELVFQGVTDKAKVKIRGTLLFPGAVDPTFPHHYQPDDEGVPGSHVEEIHFKCIDVYFNSPDIPREARKAVCLKAIYLDARYNALESEMDTETLDRWKFWPSSLAHVSVYVK